jgi:hypothetical protein
MSEGLLKATVWSTAIIVLGGICVNQIVNGDKKESEERQRKVLYEQTKGLANTDGEPGLTSSEWARVYAFLGKDYDVHESNPRTDLGIEEMRNYCDSRR